MSLISYFEKTKVTDSTGVTVNPAQEESIVLLRRIAKLLESSAVIDSTQRQRITLDSPTGTLAGLSSGAGIASASSITASVPAASATTLTVIPAWVGPVDQRWQIVDAARNVYANGIRSKLVWT